jgi:hypothetical protein
MTTATKTKRRTDVDAVSKIPDPLERVEAAEALVRLYRERMEAAHGLRDMAVVVAHLDHGVAPVVLYRDVLGVSRGLFNRMIQRAPMKSLRPKFEDPVALAKESDGAIVRNKALMKRAETLRNDTALLLMNGGTDPVTKTKVEPVTNAKIAKATDLTTARIAQIRTGTR